MIEPTETLPPEVLALPIEGRNLTEATFGAEIGAAEGATLLAFLRHLG